MTTKKYCKYPGCIYYDKKAKHYCCRGCSWDHFDMKRLNAEEKEASL